jgi:hypothetical protein
VISLENLQIPAKLPGGVVFQTGVSGREVDRLEELPTDERRVLPPPREASYASPLARVFLCALPGRGRRMGIDRLIGHRLN